MRNVTRIKLDTRPTKTGARIRTQSIKPEHFDSFLDARSYVLTFNILFLATFQDTLANTFQQPFFQLAGFRRREGCLELSADRRREEAKKEHFFFLRWPAHSINAGRPEC